MHRRSIIPLLLLLPTLHQESSSQWLRGFGPKVGVNYSIHAWEIVDPIVTHRPDIHYKAGMSVGFFVEWLSSKHFSLVTQAEYAQAGFGERMPDGPGGHISPSSTVQYHRVDYGSLALLATFSLSFEPWRARVFAGPRVDKRLWFDSRLPDIMRSYFDDLEPLTTGYTVGVGLEVRDVVGVPLQFELYYNFDGSDQYEDSYVRISKHAFGCWLGLVL